MNQRYNFKF